MHSVLASTSTARTSVTQFILSDAGKREFVLMRVNKTDCSLGETILLGKDKTPLYEVDGFVQGAGAWHLFIRKHENRRIALNTVGPLRDGNEVWLVIGGGALFAGFPKCMPRCSRPCTSPSCSFW